MPQSPNEISLKTLYEMSGYKKKLPYYKRAIQGWMGGAYLSLDGLFACVVAGGFLQTNPGLAKLVYAALFPVGLMLIVFGQVDLFTSNCMIVSLGVYYDIKKNGSRCLSLLPNRNEANGTYSVLDIFFVLINSWLWNLVGSLCIAYFLVYKGDFLVHGSTTAQYFVALAHKKFALSTDAVFLRSIAANWLVCLAVFFANGSKGALEKGFLIWFPIATFVGIGLEHSVANMFTIPCAILSSVDDSITWHAFFQNNIFQVTVGNFFGGLLVAVTFLLLIGELDVPRRVVLDSDDECLGKSSATHNPLRLSV